LFLPRAGRENPNIIPFGGRKGGGDFVQKAQFRSGEKNNVRIMQRERGRKKGDECRLAKRSLTLSSMPDYVRALFMKGGKREGTHKPVPIERGRSTRPPVPILPWGGIV